MQQYPLNRPLGAQVSAAITTNATTEINSGTSSVFSGLLVSGVLGPELSAAITTNATTTINSGDAAVFVGASVGTAGSAWTAAIYNGDPSGSGVLLATLSGDAVGPVVSPPLACPNGLYVVTSGTTAGSIQIAYEPVWTAAIYNGNPSSGGVLLATLSGDAIGPVVSPPLACPNGLYVVTSGTTAGSIQIAYEPVWTAAVYNGNPTSGGVLLTTITADTVGPVLSPLLACPQGLYVETAGTTAGSLTVCYYA